MKNFEYDDFEERRRCRSNICIRRFFITQKAIQFDFTDDFNPAEEILGMRE